MRLLRILEAYKPPQKTWSHITSIKVKLTLAKAKIQKWDAIGPDSIQNVWHKGLHSLHIHLAREYMFIYNLQCTDMVFCRQTYSITKTEETRNPKNYRPINCTKTTYKNLCSRITNTG